MTYSLEALDFYFAYIGTNNLMKTSRIGLAAKEKLRKVIAWVLRARPILNKHITNNCEVFFYISLLILCLF